VLDHIHAVVRRGKEGIGCGALRANEKGNPYDKCAHSSIEMQPPIE
jgi:hypothetical protein